MIVDFECLRLLKCLLWRIFFIAPPSTGTNSPVASTTTDVTSWTSQPVTPPKTTSAVPVTTTTTKTTAGGAFVCPGSGSYSDPFSCSHYYTCDNGNAYHFVSSHPFVHYLVLKFSMLIFKLTLNLSKGLSRRTCFQSSNRHLRLALQCPWLQW